MLLGIELLCKERNVQSIYMGMDNQATILATTSLYSSSSHSLTDMFIESLDGTLNKHDLPHLTICWVPGHANIAGNESIDREAKKAAEGDSSPGERLPVSLRRHGVPVTLPYSKAAIIQSFNTKLKDEIKADFTSTKHGKCLQRLNPTMSSTSLPPSQITFHEDTQAFSFS